MDVKNNLLLNKNDFKTLAVILRSLIKEDARLLRDPFPVIRRYFELLNKIEAVLERLEG